MADFTQLNLNNINSSTLGNIVSISNSNFKVVESYINALLENFTYDESNNSIALSKITAESLNASSEIILVNGSTEVFKVNSLGEVESKNLTNRLVNTDKLKLLTQPEITDTPGVRGEIIWNGVDFYGFTNFGWKSLSSGGGTGGDVITLYYKMPVHNETESTITAESVVYLTGYNDTFEYPTVDVLGSTDDIPFGIFVEDLDTDESGSVLIKGTMLSSLDTQAATIGDYVYVDGSGALTLTSTDRVVGLVLTLEATGILFIDVPGLGSANTTEDGTTIAIGTPTDGDYTDGLIPLTINTTIANATDLVNVALKDHDDILEKLLPTVPQDLSGLALTMTLYTALEAGTGSSNNCTDDTTPTASVSDFYDGDSGTLTAEIDTVISGTRVLSTADDTGTYTALTITADEDPYLGQSGKEGFYKQLSAEVTAVSALSLASHTYQIKHSDTGNSQLLTFNVDNPLSSSISGDSITLPGSTSRYVSGVPSLSATDTIDIDFTIDDAVGKHYNDTKVAIISSTQITNVSIASGSIPTPSENGSIAITGETLDLLDNVYVEDISVTVTPYNSKDVSGTPSSTLTGSRIDTLSDESTRLIAGSGQYPASGYGAAYDSSISLKTTYTEELQLLNGKYQRPTGDYSSNSPVAGPDYSTGMGTGDRYVIPDAVTVLSSASAFTITIEGDEGFSGAETSGVEIYVKVEGVTGWLDANSAYPGVGSPVSDGDPALVFGSSDGNTKRVTFGSTPRTGNLYVRIGLPDGSTKKFSGVTISDIV